MIEKFNKFLSIDDAKIVYDSIMEYLRRINYQFLVIKGRGNPEGVASANKGTIYLDENAPVNATLYIKEEEDGRKGWKVIKSYPDGITDVKTWVDGSGDTHNVTIENGIITEWTIV